MMRGRCETHCRGIGTADLAACEHVLLERKNLILPMDANITLVQSFGPPVTKSLREPVRLHLGNRQTRCSRRATASAVAQVKSGYLFALHSASVWAGISFSAQASSAVCANLGARSRTHSK